MMRLTLRTLLAYLDDILSPADTKIIGQKIQESPMAQLLVSRIREVMRRRRLKAPEVFGPEMGIDPNIVSQYLDNTLPPERYADVERVLLASDEMLAEAAACHQVLALVLGEPAEVPLSSRERLYALGPVDASSQLTVPDQKAASSSRTPHSIPAHNGAVTSPYQSPQANDDERITTVPDYLKPTPWSQQLVPTAIVAVLVIVCAALLTPGLMSGLHQAKNEIQRKVDRDKSAVAQNDTESDPENESKATVADANDSLPPKPSPSVSVATKLPQGIDPTPPSDIDDTQSKVAATEKDPEPPASALLPSRPGKEVAMVDSKQPKTKPETPAPPAPNSPITYDSTDGALIQFDETRRHWFKVPARTPLDVEKTIANLEPFDGIIDFEGLGVRATLVGETLVRLLSVQEARINGFSVGRGRILFQPTRTDEKPRAVISVAIGEDLWTLEMLTRDTVCGLEVSVRESTQFQKLNDFHWYQATLSVVSGTAKWTNRNGNSLEIGEHTALNIIPERAATVRSTPISIPSVPDWCDAAKRRAMPLRKLQAVFEKSIVPDEPIDETMLSLVKNTKNPKIAELAARCLSATDNYKGLVEILAECSHEEARFAARDGLRQWLPMNAENGPRLNEELAMLYPKADAEAIYRMLWGFSREDVKEARATSLQFTNWMRNPRLEIRELADYWVERLTGRRTEYRASGAPAQRETLVRRLEEQIDRDNGLIKGQ